MNPPLKTILKEGTRQFGINLRPECEEAFDVLLEELLKWNRKINLTAIRTEEGVVIKHFLDSLSLFPYLSAGCSVLDMGSGAGFPGIPLKIVEPSLQVTLIEATLKKVDFQRHILRKLGIKGIEVFHGRAEDPKVQEGLREKFDIAVSRAFSEIQTFLNWSDPYLKEGGMAIAMKGRGTEEELSSLSEGVSPRFRLHRSAALTLPSSTMRRTILLFEKQRLSIPSRFMV